jgi:hypothetical protein
VPVREALPYAALDPVVRHADVRSLKISGRETRLLPAIQAKLRAKSVTRARFAWVYGAVIVVPRE